MKSIVCWVILCWVTVANADEPNSLRGWETVYDFFVQDVCTDQGGGILADATPVDGSGKCPQHRNLRVGEQLPYHKHDWPGRSKEKERPDGLQSNDTFPIETKAYGIAVLQLRSFVDENGSPKPYKSGHGGGGLYLFTSNSVASGLTEDPNGLQFFYGPKCASTDPVQRIVDAWVVVDKSYSADAPGSMVTRQIRYADKCDHLTYAYTSWITRPVNFRVRSGRQISTRTFRTIVSDHFGGRNPDLARNMERFYFTQPLGLVRWERWQNVELQARDKDQRLSEEVRKSGRCDAVQETPQGSGRWVLVACRQYTNLVASRDPAGELSRSWYQKLRNDPAAQFIFGD